MYRISDFLINHKYFFCIWGTLFILCLQELYSKFRYRFVTISFFETINIINDDKVFLLDIRSENEFSKQHIARSINFCCQEHSLPDYKKLISSIPNKVNVVIIYQNYQVAKKIFTILQKNRSNSFYVLQGSIEDWKNENLPIITKAQKS